MTASLPRIVGWWNVMCIIAIALMAGGAATNVARAQPADSIRAEAQRAFHGPDRTGKDGPLAKVGMDLALLYYEYRAHRDEGGTPSAFRPQSVRVPVDSGFVTIDATAADTAATLRAELERLGLVRAAAAGRVVSGRLPIEAIPDMAALEALRSARPARAMTQAETPTPAPAPEADSAPTDPDPEGRSILWYIGAAAIVLIGGALAFFLRR